MDGWNRGWLSGGMGALDGRIGRPPSGWVVGEGLVGGCRSQ